MKKCPECNVIKDKTEYYKCSSRNDGLQVYCKECKKIKFSESKKKSDKKYQKKYYSVKENKDKRNKVSRQYQLDNLDKQKEYQKKYRQTKKYKDNNKKRRKREYDLKYKKDPIFTLRLTLRNRLKNAVRNNFQKGKTLELLGCDIKYFKQFIENKFDKHMNWGNYGDYWEIDHIKPCSKFDLEIMDEQKKCFHYSNLQPLEVIKNRIKSNKYE